MYSQPLQAIGFIASQDYIVLIGKDNSYSVRLCSSPLSVCLDQNLPKYNYDTGQKEKEEENRSNMPKLRPPITMLSSRTSSTCLDCFMIL